MPFLLSVIFIPSFLTWLTSLLPLDLCMLSLEPQLDQAKPSSIPFGVIELSFMELIMVWECAFIVSICNRFYHVSIYFHSPSMWHSVGRQINNQINTDQCLEVSNQYRSPLKASFVVCVFIKFKILIIINLCRGPVRK